MSCIEDFEQKQRIADWENDKGKSRSDFDHYFESIKDQWGLDDYNETTISNLLTFCDEMQKQVISYADNQANGITFLGEFSSDPLYDESYITAGIFNSIKQKC